MAMSLPDETTAKIQRAARRAPKPRRELTPIEEWAWAPVIVIRAGLVAMYAINVYFAIMATIAGVPVFSQTTPNGWTPTWAFSLMFASVVAAVCVSSDEPGLPARPRWRMAEIISSGAVLVLTGTYSAALHIVGHLAGDVSRQAVGAAVLGLCVLPTFRLIWLVSQLGKATTEGGTKQ